MFRGTKSIKLSTACGGLFFLAGTECRSDSTRNGSKATLASTTRVAMRPIRKTVSATIVLFATLASCQHASNQNSATPDSKISVASPQPHAPTPSPPATPSEDDFDIDTVARELEPVIHCAGREVLWGDACTAAPEVLAHLAKTHPIPAELRECGESLVACRHAGMLCELPNETLEGDAGQSVSVDELVGALYLFGENGLSRMCSKRYQDGCESFRNYPKMSPYCRRAGH